MAGKSLLGTARFTWLETVRIDRADRGFALSWPGEREVEQLAAGFRACGMLEPLWVLEGGDAGYRLVHGFRRLAAADKASLNDAPALIFPPGTNELELFRLRLAGQAGRLSAVEAFKVIGRLAGRFPLGDKALARDYLPLVGLGPALKILNQLRLLEKLEDPVSRYCADNSVALREAALWAGFPREGQRALLVLVRAVGPGANLLRGYLQLLREICVRDKLKVEEILFDPAIRAVMLDPQVSRSGGRETVHRILRGLRYPLTRQIEERFGAARRELELPEGVSLEPPPFFEGDKVKVAFEAASPGDLEKKARGLLQASRGSAVRGLFQALGAPPGEPERKADGKC